ncbi:MAG: hypothetical protein IJX99_08155 [Clostridia bacterium]|nr:hypothetical protein [Clostridia bacterium]
MKKISFIICTIIFCLGIGCTSFAMDGDETYKEKVPRIIFVEDEEMPKVAAGEELKLLITYKNDSSHSAKNIRITPSFEEVPLVYERPVAYERILSLRPDKEDKASFNLKVADDAKVGVYGLKFKLEFENQRDETYTSEATVHFNVYKEKVKPIVAISNISTGEAPVSAGGNFKLTFDVSNNGEVKADNVEILITGQSEDKFMVVDSNDYKYIGTLESNQKIHQEFDINVSDKISKGNNTIGVDIKYKDTSGNELSTQKTIYVLDVKSENEVEEEDETAATPKIIISSYMTNPNTIVAGNDFSFSFTVKNTSKEKRLRNMKITISSQDGAFIITKGSNTFYVEEILQDDSVTKIIDLKAKQSLTSNSYPVIIDFDYEDYSGKQYAESETINIPVTEYSKLVINSVMPGQGYTGSNTSLSFDYVNMGKATVSNLTASVEGDYTCVQSINYIGNLEPGNSDYYDIEVIPSKSGTNYGVLVLSFEDSSGRIVEVKKDFEGFAMEEPVFEDPGIMDPGVINPGMMEPLETKEPIETWVIVLSGLGSFMITFIISKLITTKIVRKKLEDEI